MFCSFHADRCGIVVRDDGVRQEGSSAAAARETASRPVRFHRRSAAPIPSISSSVPSANTDSSRPANVARVDVYAFTGPARRRKLKF